MRGSRARLISVNLKQGAAGFLGRELSAALITDMERVLGLDVCGERGEYHTFVSDGPLFARPVKYQLGETLEMEGHRLLDLVPL